MNVVFDCNVSDSPELRSALLPILPEGTIPFMLDSLKGIKGTPHDNEGIVFITSLPTDVLGYHGTFFKKYENVPQWFIILLNENEHGVMLLKNAAIKYNLHNCKIYQLNNSDELYKTITEIHNCRKIVPGKVLLLSKHRKASVLDFASYIFGEQKERYDIRLSSNSSETDAAILLLCGHEAKDFIDVNIPEGMEPYFVLLNPEREVQQFIDSEELINRISLAYHMTTERVKNRLFFISVKAAQWKNMPNAGSSAVEQGVLMWDEFGLPVPRRAYTANKISNFFVTTYIDEKRLKDLLM